MLVPGRCGEVGWTYLVSEMSEDCVQIRLAAEALPGIQFREAARDEQRDERQMGVCDATTGL
jgi:hypothetical protein